MPQPKFQKALVASSSKVMQNLVERFLRGHAHRIASAKTLEETRRQLADLESTDLLVLDTDLEDPAGLVLLEDVSSCQPAKRPAVVVIGAHAVLDTETRAALGGAVGFLAKPISLRAFSAVLWSFSRTFEAAAPRFRAAPIGEAVLLDAPMGDCIARWELDDISQSGALLRCHVTYVPGTILPLELRLGDTGIPVSARVVRVQGEACSSLAAVGVDFEPDAATRLRIRDALTQLEPLPQVTSDRLEPAAAPRRSIAPDSA